MKVYLDMDGVLTDFHNHVQNWYGAQKTNITEWDYKYKEDFGMSGNEFWDGLSEDFWETMPWTAEGKQILDYVNLHNPIILTSPPMSGGGIRGKIRWIKKNLPEIWKERRFFLGSRKHYLASKDDVLIDDCEDNINDFNGAGGHGILVPRPWNSLRGKNVLTHLMYSMNCR